MPLIMQGDLTGRWYIVTRYTKKDGCIVAQTKYDCTDRINEIIAKFSPLTLEMVERVARWHFSGMLPSDERARTGAWHEACGDHEDPDPCWHCCDWRELAQDIDRELGGERGDPSTAPGVRRHP